MKTLTSLAAALWFALLSGVLIAAFWLDRWWNGEGDDS